MIGGVSVGVAAGQVGTLDVHISVTGSLFSWCGRVETLL